MKPLPNQRTLNLQRDATGADLVNDLAAVECLVCGKAAERKGDGLYWCSSCGCGFKAPKPRPGGAA